jgi:hypothetical protein
MIDRIRSGASVLFPIISSLVREKNMWLEIKNIQAYMRGLKQNAKKYLIMIAS